MHAGYKTLSYSAGLSSCSVKHRNIFKTKVFAPKIYKNYFRIMNFVWKFESSTSRTLRVNTCWIEQPDSCSWASD